MSGALVLFTRDLRVRDQPALATAVREYDVVVPAFVLDRELLRGACGSPNRLAFLLDCLGDLDDSLAERGARLLVRRGDVIEQALRLVREFDLSAICMSEDVTPYARRRQARLAARCERARVRLRAFPGVTVVPAGEIVPSGGDHYRVFTPYWRVWSNAQHRPAASTPRRIPVPNTLPDPSARATIANLTRKPPSTLLPRGGEIAGRAQLTSWLRRDLADYEQGHDDLAGASTSCLSPYLHFGCLSARTVLDRASSGVRAPAAEGFPRQLCWRDFHHQVLAARPDMTHADYRPRGDRWRIDVHASEAWRAGLTGFPIVDAGMRQLAREGFMHNRARMIVASFLAKTLYLDWRIGTSHFARLLVDADVANNVGNWQWIAGTGNDTRPNRVLNPLRQAKRFDPRGDYVRRHVPELEAIAGAAVHEPWLLPRGCAPRDYPPPILDPAASALRPRTQS
ncbi:MAG TPA: deoxyribodipyrimidine photo-lyase [Solirubrobacteraceae bacterium]|nr:deoxyribodipyrimidine photo-lyase [Solirubrobacteraceae bacterium]